MFNLALIIGIYSYSIMILGFLGFLHPQLILIFSIIFLLSIFLISKNIIPSVNPLSYKINLSKLEKIVLALLFLQAMVNLIGALGPELAFDALWYHLTFPKIYLQNHSLIYIPGGLLYYSTIPKLLEMIYTAQLAFGNEILPKLTQFTFGVLINIALYKISRKFLNRTFSLLAVLLFYSNLVVGWESITSYIDLARVFFEVMALWGFLKFYERKKTEDLIKSSLMLGLAISTKLLSLISIPIYIALLVVREETLRQKIKEIGIFFLVALAVPLPWFVFSFVHTGNPVYPLITNYDTHQDLNIFNPIKFVLDIYNVFTRSPDPISPFYIISFPLIFKFFKTLKNSKIKIIFIYSCFALLAWYFSPHHPQAGGRYILPYLPAFSIVSIFCVSLVNSRILKKYFILVLLFLSVLSIGYRGLANAKYLPVIFGKETKQEFLTKNLNFSFGDFYDTDGYFKTHLKPTDTVLLYGFHNLYYLDFNFIDSSWVKKGDRFNYIATQGTNLSGRFSFMNLIYYNPTTKIRLYTAGGVTWTY